MKRYLVYLMGALYIGAGINHFINPAFYIKMIDGLLPYPALLNAISGIAEIALGIGVCIPATRRISAIGIILLLVAIFPANINMALHAGEWGLNPIGLYLRLPLQFVLIYWAYGYSRVRTAPAANRR